MTCRENFSFARYKFGRIWRILKDLQYLVLPEFLVDHGICFLQSHDFPVSPNTCSNLIWIKNRIQSWFWYISCSHSLIFFFFLLHFDFYRHHSSILVTIRVGDGWWKPEKQFENKNVWLFFSLWSQFIDLTLDLLYR